MLSIDKLAVVGWESANSKWPSETCDDLFETSGVKRDDGVANDDGTDWDKATFPFTVHQPGMITDGMKTDGTPKLKVDRTYSREQAMTDAGEMYDHLGRNDYVRQSCNGFDLGARKAAPPKATKTTGGPSEADKAIWCMFDGKAAKKVTSAEIKGKSPKQLAELYDEKH